MSDTLQDTTSSSGQNKRRRQLSEAGLSSSSTAETKRSGSKRRKRWKVGAAAVIKLNEYEGQRKTSYNMVLWNNSYRWQEPIRQYNHHKWGWDWIWITDSMWTKCITSEVLITCTVCCVGADNACFVYTFMDHFIHNNLPIFIAKFRLVFPENSVLQNFLHGFQGSSTHYFEDMKFT